ncbi:hypothetical protein NG800_004900 [Epilithonimonas ginsengisoli]|uniref:Uncharacterized protein n=1 Tax=Epilithonimonas ginsengisoli TaxID=1245592 RepID=A0ABU4JF91_9FLAO|nr:MULTISPECIES: hypothetical protein [Chryseobacterium group]MBV6879602.1 hypothetical protein [Epilithonimonas sp. FP105]MDW8548238.1 hypothetical protein [Epilithonimonas ginsengisoli]OAH73458.1 hypothetical protein AXA65_07910 [Chryseobacterium sp. FP211-J200]
MALTRTTQQEETLIVEMNFEETFATIKNAYSTVGKIQSFQEKFGRLTGSIGSGVLNMNKADVTINIKKIGDSTSEIKIIASAQEGLISQNTCGKAITRTLDAIE